MSARFTGDPGHGVEQRLVFHGAQRAGRDPALFVDDERGGDGGGRDRAGETEQDLARLVVDARVARRELRVVGGGGGLLVLEVDAEELDAAGLGAGGDVLERRPSARHGAHHEAQKLMTVTLPLAIAVCAPSRFCPSTTGAGLRSPGSKICTVPSPATKRVSSDPGCPEAPDVSGAAGQHQHREHGDDGTARKGDMEEISLNYNR